MHIRMHASGTKTVLVALIIRMSEECLRLSSFRRGNGGVGCLLVFQFVALRDSIDRRVRYTRNKVNWGRNERGGGGVGD